LQKCEPRSPLNRTVVITASDHITAEITLNRIVAIVAFVIPLLVVMTSYLVM
jgi:hypothetical protein